MTIPVHRDGDARRCGATTIVSGQSTVFINNKLASVLGDENSHGSGQLLASTNPGTVFVGSKKLVTIGSAADPDILCPVVGPPHCNPESIEGSGDVFAL